MSAVQHLHRAANWLRSWAAQALMSAGFAIAPPEFLEKMFNFEE